MDAMLDYESDISDDNDSINDGFSAPESSDDEGDMYVEENEERYDSEGIESDDDGRGCCHWSGTARVEFQDTIEPLGNIPEYGKPAVAFPDDAKPHNVVESIMDDQFIIICIESTNEHGARDPEFMQKIGVISTAEKGIDFIRGFFAVRWHLKMLGYPQHKWAWSEDPLESQPDIKKMMSREVFRLLLKHFRVVKGSVLSAKNHPTYHPLQNINAGVEYLREKAISKWSFGWKLCIDEGRVRSKSKRNPYKIRNPDKPIRMGWTINKICDKGELGGNYVANHVVKVGKKTYRNPANGKNYDIVDQLSAGYKDTGRLIVMDSGFPTTKLMEDAKRLWNTRLIATQRGNTAHFPQSHKENLRSTKAFARGFSKTLHSGFLNVTYWNDNNAVVFLDNDIKSGEEFWVPINVNQGAMQAAIHVPLVAQLYREIYGWVDRTNQQLSYYSTEFRSVRKQSRIFDCLCEMYLLVNEHTMWRNCPNLVANLKRDAKMQCTFRFEIIRIWYARFRMTNGTAQILHYPTTKPRAKERSLEATLTSPRKGSHALKRISASESSSKEGRLKCRICHKKTSFMCSKCSSPGDPFALCSPETGKDCWNEFHIAREYDIPSSQSQEENAAME